VLGEDYGGINNLFADPCSPPIGSNGVAILLGHNSDNRDSNKFEIKYALNQPSNMQLKVLDLSGQTMATLDRGFREKGSYTIKFDPAQFKLKQGTYIYQIDAAGKTYGRKILVQ
jgi:hypothetical protein